MNRVTLTSCIVLMFTAMAVTAVTAQRKTAPNPKPAVNRVLVRRAETARVAMDGALLLDAMDTVVRKAGSEVHEIMLLSSDTKLIVEEERSKLVLNRSERSQQHSWKLDPGKFDSVLYLEIQFNQPSRQFAGDPLRINVKETWTLEKASGSAAKKSWTLDYLITAEGVLGAQEAERTAAREMLLVIAERAPILAEVHNLMGSRKAVVEAAMTYFTRMLKNQDAGIRQYAASVIGRFPRHSKKVVPNLIDALADSVATVRQAAAFSLGRIGPDAKPSLPALRNLLRDSSARVRVVSAEALCKLGETEAALPVLVESLKDRDRYAAERSAEVLGDLGPAAEPAVGALTEEVKKRAGAHWNAAQALGKIGPAARVSIPTLLEALKIQDDGALRFYAAEALVSIDPKAANAALPELMDKASRKGDYFRERSIKALGKMGAEATSAIPVLTDALKESDEKIRTATAEALRNIRNH